MVNATVRLPGLLTRFTDGERTIPVQADTAAGALEQLVEAYPQLDPHLYDDHGDLRTHLLLFVDGDQIGPAGAQRSPLSEAAETSLELGATVTVLQSVSGG